MDVSFKMAILIATFIAFFSTNVRTELKLLSVVLRHGDRAPDNNAIEMFAENRQQSNIFDYTEPGCLTNSGKVRSYQLGEYLRQQYEDFLGESYYSSQVHSRSTNFDRTKMTLQLVLSALYPPKNKQIWNPNLLWQPIPTHYLKALDDILMGPEGCPKYIKVRQEVEALPQVVAKVEALKDFMEDLQKKTGTNLSRPLDLHLLNQGLMAKASLNLTLPQWARNNFTLGKLHDGSNLEYEIFSYNTELRRLNGGVFLRTFIDDMTAHISGSLDRRRKLFIYGGHETNIVAILQALGVYTPHVPKYTSAIFVELHEENLDYYVKIKYYKGIPQNHEDMIIAGCGQKCTLDQFKIALKDVIASDEDVKCDKRSFHQDLEKNNSKVVRLIPASVLRGLNEEKTLKSLE